VVDVERTRPGLDRATTVNPTCNLSKGDRNRWSRPPRTGLVPVHAQQKPHSIRAK